MTEVEPPVTDRQLRMMAYIDGELSPDDRRQFELELREDPELATEIADYRVLMDMGRSSPLLEPADHEIRRFWSHFYNRNEWRVGWTLLTVGASLLVAYGFRALWVESVPMIVRIAATAVLLGIGVLFWSTLRQKLRAHRFDRYRGVLR